MDKKETGSLEGLVLGVLALLGGAAVALYELFWGGDVIIGLAGIVLGILGAIAVNKIEG